MHVNTHVNEGTKLFHRNAENHEIKNLEKMLFDRSCVTCSTAYLAVTFYSSHSILSTDLAVASGSNVNIDAIQKLSTGRKLIILIFIIMSFCI